MPPPTRVQPYIHFAGETRVAMEYYHSIFGGTLTLNPAHIYLDDGTFAEDPEFILYAELISADGWSFLASDIAEGDPLVQSIPEVNICISGNVSDTTLRWFKQLANNGTIDQPLEMQESGAYVGIVRDQFTITWIFQLETENEN
ncbi:Uncharacterised protein [Corynebacterium kutscheri]|uniref:PhnB-like domain-containing protein n=1 Tax=Corynebacterium kutscheri TaxID=35755 RepID=A0A0F6TE89_9CORY|nr:VOC family protein [Corynebacterium kutscheri]AKE41801.1 hypothetical protein UL82_08210 [Corynebacterium kutscheri]VEH09076.1 Uncharacterised protein [Corynebacterium kutscheri]VEH10127.1 Uncharacterised protein [Corynebacterium kutscheri]VEH80209.1 Uncharacterised protein [Corynebacterium kutscheri]